MNFQIPFMSGDLFMFSRKKLSKTHVFTGGILFQIVIATLRIVSYDFRHKASFNYVILLFHIFDQPGQIASVYGNTVLAHKCCNQSLYFLLLNKKLRTARS